MTAKQQEEVDINDVFDNLLLAEEKLAEESYQLGLATGTNEGNVEAYHFGYHRGAEIGAELGFYYGVLCAEGEQHQDGINSKAKQLLKELKQDIINFPTFNNLEVDILDKLLQIRNKYKRLCVLLKITATYSKPNELTF